MATLQHNITTTLTKELLTAGDEVNNVKYISPGSTLYLNKDNNIAFDNGVDGFSLRTQIQDDSGGAVSVDVIITR